MPVNIHICHELSPSSTAHISQLTKMDVKNPSEKIAVYSFDFDGCLFNFNYLFDEKEESKPESEIERMLAANAHLINEVANEIKKEKISKVTVMTGSLRQSRDMDQLNATRKYRSRESGSSFPKLKPLCAAISQAAGLDCCLDTTLMADICNDLKAGQSYLNILDPKFNGIHAKYNNIDDTKITLIYTQVHKIASENPDATIMFNFYDDHDDILAPIKLFYTRHPELLPHNVSLRLHNYDGRQLSTVWSLGYRAIEIGLSSNDLCDPNPIQGTGMIDHNYRTTVKGISREFLVPQKLDYVASGLYAYREKLADWIVKNRVASPGKSTDAKSLDSFPFNKEDGKYRNLSQFAPKTALNLNRFPAPLNNAKVLKRREDRKIQDNLDKQSVIVSDKCYEMYRKLEWFVNEESNRLEMKIPLAKEKNYKNESNKSFFSCCTNLYREADAIEFRILALEKFHRNIFLYHHLDGLTIAEKYAVKCYKEQLTPILSSYINDLPWVKEYINTVQELKVKGPS